LATTADAVSFRICRVVQSQIVLDRSSLTISSVGPEPDDAHLTGVILRLNPDGTTPTDNPFFAAGAAMPGHPVSGDLWEQENGDDSFSELNRVEPGFNSGWVQIMGPPNRLDQYKAIETSPENDPCLGTPYFGLQQLRWPPPLIADSPAEALSRLFVLPGSHYSEPEFSWKFELAPGAIGFVRGRGLDHSMKAICSWVVRDQCWKADTCFTST
jgi:aldose sugar dehydrogenase